MIGAGTVPLDERLARLFSHQVASGELAALCPPPQSDTSAVETQTLWTEAVACFVAWPVRRERPRAYAYRLPLVAVPVLVALVHSHRPSSAVTLHCSPAKLERSELYV